MLLQICFPHLSTLVGIHANIRPIKFHASFTARNGTVMEAEIRLNSANPMHVNNGKPIIGKHIHEIKDWEDELSHSDSLESAEKWISQWFNELFGKRIS